MNTYLPTHKHMRLAAAAVCLSLAGSAALAPQVFAAPGSLGPTSVATTDPVDTSAVTHYLQAHGIRLARPGKPMATHLHEFHAGNHTALHNLGQMPKAHHRATPNDVPYQQFE